MFEKSIKANIKKQLSSDIIDKKIKISEFNYSGDNHEK